MMRPMKLAGSQLMFGNNCLEYIKTLSYKRAFIVTGGSSMKRSGMLRTVTEYFEQTGAKTEIFDGVEPDPSFNTVMAGAEKMKNFQPDIIVALGGGSVMDGAKAMWVYYEHPEFTMLEEMLQANPFPKLRRKADFACIPSTAGTASEVSRSVVITDQGIKHGFGHMEMMPDIAICDPQVTVSMPAHITAETGMDAMTHALEAFVSQRANYLSDILAGQAVKDIFKALPEAYCDGSNIEAREIMLNASMIAGMAFTNVSLGIVHSMAHTIGSLFHVAHGLADAVILPYVIKFNSSDDLAKARYKQLSDAVGAKDMAEAVGAVNKQLGIPKTLGGIIGDRDAYMRQLDQMAAMALADGCTKTNPVIPDQAQMRGLFKLAYDGE